MASVLLDIKQNPEMFIVLVFLRKNLDKNNKPMVEIQ